MSVTRKIVAVGGGTRAGLWTQVVSDVAGVVQHVPQETIGASYGDALLAAIGAGLVPADTDWSRDATQIEPGEDGALYDELYELYGELYPATADLAHRLAELQRREATSRLSSPTR